MFVRSPPPIARRYVQLVESYRDDAGRVKKRTVATLGRLGQVSGELDSVIDGLIKVAGRTPTATETRASSVPSALSAASMSFETARAGSRQELACRPGVSVLAVRCGVTPSRRRCS